ncbi:unnamed protein product [Clavelina lepadiformis]|uniref:Centlein n=1 Tax=Clavelina lepadiformis TaxID=159417 RepID=A0ABP0GQI0_CLALP
MEDLFKSKDAEISKLLAENRELSDELRQCQADKEFVWSLWKRLQVSSPDLTQAISLVMAREKEKAETKDRKVLEILQSKDEQIKDLEETITNLSKEMDKMKTEKSDLELKGNKNVTDCLELQNEISKLNHQIKKMQEENEERISSYKRSLSAVENKKDEFAEKITALLTDLQAMRSKLQDSQDINEELSGKIMLLRNEAHDKDAVLRRLTKEREGLVIELENVKCDYNKVKNGEVIRKQDLQTKDRSYQDIKEAYEQLQTHNHQQKQLITQLQELQSNTQKVVSEQESKHRNEKRDLQSVYDELTKKLGTLDKDNDKLTRDNAELKRRVQVQDQALHDTERELKKSIEMATRNRRNYNFTDMDDLAEQVDLQRKEIEALQRRLHDKARRNRRSDSPYDDAGADQTFSPIIERGAGRNPSRSRSLSPGGANRHVHLMQKKLKATETKLEDTKQLLHLKKEEIREIQRAHNKRLERLRTLQSDYRSLKSGLDEEDGRGSPKRRHRRAAKSDPRNLRQENSETVWNDLAQYKQENRALLQERISMEEELDGLRVQTAMDRAAIQDLNLCLKNEKEELVSRLRSSSNVHDRLSSTPKRNKHETKPSRRATKNLERRLENAAEDNRLLKKDKDRLLDDNRSLKDEIKALKREATETRQNGTKLRQENGEVRRKVEALKCDNDQLLQETGTLRTEIQGLRTENAAVRSENSSLRSENSDLRQDVADFKAELVGLKNELQEIDLSTAETERRSTASKQSGSPHEGQKPSIAKKHQKFLNRSIQNMKEAFGEDFHPGELTDPVSTTTMSEDTQHPEEGGRSDASSLGQSIVRASRRRKVYNRDLDEDKDDDDTLVDESVDPSPRRMKSSRPASLPRHGDGGSVAALKRRLASLQAQCSSLRNAKQNAVKKVNDEKEKNSQLQSELSSCQNKIKNMKQAIQRLNRESELLQREREDLQQGLEDARKSQPPPQVHSDADYKYLESKLKVSNNEAQKLSDQVKDLRKEVESKNEQASIEKEKLSRLERDVGMKRQLIDELRVKVKDHEGRTKEDHNKNLDLQEKLRQIEEDLSHKKNHVESLRRQLQVCTEEKSRYEAMYNKSREELEKRCQQLTSVQASKLEAENVTSQVQQEAEHQLQALASRSELALDKLKGKSERADEKTKEFNTFVTSLTSQLFDLLCRQRDLLLQEKISQAEMKSRLNESGGKRASSSMSHAQTVACNILNMSKSDFEDLMAPVDVGRWKTEQQQWEEDKILMNKQDQNWKNKVEKIAAENPPFAKSLCCLLWDKIQDVVKLTEDRFRLQTEQLEDELLGKS